MQTLLGMTVGSLLLVAFIWWLPVILIALSNKTQGVEKLIWILLIFFFSWFSWILYLIVAPLNREEI